MDYKFGKYKKLYCLPNYEKVKTSTEKRKEWLQRQGLKLKKILKYLLNVN